MLGEFDLLAAEGGEAEVGDLEVEAGFGGVGVAVLGFIV